MHAFLHIENKQKTNKQARKKERKKPIKVLISWNFYILYVFTKLNSFFKLLFVFFCIIIILYIAVLCAAMLVIGKHYPFCC